jgi:hypothetical protein
VYSWRGFDRIDEVIRIPAIEYLLTAVVALLIWAGVRVAAVRR